MRTRREEIRVEELGVVGDCSAVSSAVWVSGVFVVITGFCVILFCFAIIAKVLNPPVSEVKNSLVSSPPAEVV